MTTTVPLGCKCGSVKGTIQIVPKQFFHVQCLCCDCQNFSGHLGCSTEILDEFGGSDLLQTYPSAMQITQGQSNIGAVRLSGKGLFRWHTTCCDMPIANTMASSKIPFVGVFVNFMAFSSEQEKLDVLGPITIKAFGKYAIGDKPEDVHVKFPLSYMPKIIGFMLKGLLLKKSSPSPFFKHDKPAVEAKVVR